MIHIDEKDFNTYINVDKLVLIDFGAAWCGPCRQLLPILEDISNSKQYNLDIYSVSVDNNHNLAAQYRIMSIPSMILFKNGKELDRKVGFMDKSSLIDWIQGYL